MDTSLVIGLVVIVVVGFFAYQWWSKSGRRITGGSRRLAAAAATPAPIAAADGTGGAGVPGNVLAAASAAATATPMRSEPPTEGRYPEVPGQTEAEMRNPEPVQRRVQPSQQQPVGHEGHGPAQFESNLTHPEQMFHQPQGQQAVPTMKISDVPGGRAAPQSTPLSGNQQAFSPEMAQNGGALGGNSLFAYDGMEPTGFAAF
jgi:hypothetical protein